MSRMIPREKYPSNVYSKKLKCNKLSIIKWQGYEMNFFLVQFLDHNISIMSYKYIFQILCIFMNWNFYHHHWSWRLFVLKIILSDIIRVTPDFSWNPSFYIYSVSLYLQFISCKQHIIGSYFFIQSENLPYNCNV